MGKEGIIVKLLIIKWYHSQQFRIWERTNKKKNKKSMSIVLPVGSKGRTWRRKYSFHPTGERDTLQNRTALFVIGYCIAILLLRGGYRYCDELLLKYECFVLYKVLCWLRGKEGLTVIFIYSCSKKNGDDFGGWLRNTRLRITIISESYML